MINRNIAVIGAGRSGLVAAKYGIQEGFNVTIYEKNEAIGGTWRYTKKTGKDEYGLDIHTAMYKQLRTNGTIQHLAYADFSFPHGTKSYASHTEVLKYLESYADHFDLKRFIKFNHNVIHVTPIENEQWEIIVKDLMNSKFERRIYDFMFVANGHNSVPNMPEIAGASEFKGKIIHSHDFRDAERYRGDRILIIGSGPSGTDIADMCSKIAERITWSQRNISNISKKVLENRKNLILPNGSIQGDVKRFTVTGAEFSDESHETFSVIIFATGYHFKFSFLSADCGIFVEDNYVQPLYKHIINIEHPTMAFIGMTLASDHDLEIKFAMKFFTDAKKLPTKHEMLEDNQKQYQILWNQGVPKQNMHRLSADAFFKHLNQLSDAAELEIYPKVLHSIHEHLLMEHRRNYKEYRKYNYTIIDEKTFTAEICNEFECK